MSRHHKNPKRTGKKFWNQEYRTAGHLALSPNHSEDLEKFTRWCEREFGEGFLNSKTQVLDLGCGNGRNLIFLAKSFGCQGVGFDISESAIAQAKKASVGLKISYQVSSIANPLPVPDESQDLVLDMMTSHFLNQAERTKLLGEVSRVLKPGGLLFLKTFLLDEDLNAKRLLREYPAEEAGSYIHPEIGVREHVSTESELRSVLEPKFEIQKISKSHRHLIRGQAGKRRSISVYAEKLE